ncbi:hypothetical protein AgCh_004101 [Apium graveolens]
MNVFQNYTLEVLLIHVLSTLFNAVESDSVIRLSTLVDHLDTAVHSQITLLTRRIHQREWSPIVSDQTSDDATKTSEKKRRSYNFGNELVSFLQKRGLIEVSPIGNIEDEPIRKKNGDFYIAKHQNMHCTFPVSDLPISTYDNLNKPTDVKDGNNDAVRTSLDQSDDSSGYGYGSSDENDVSSDDKTTSETIDGTTSSGGNDSNNHNSNDSHNKEPFSRIKDLDDP